MILLINLKTKNISKIKRLLQKRTKYKFENYKFLHVYRKF